MLPTSNGSVLHFDKNCSDILSIAIASGVGEDDDDNKTDCCDDVDCCDDCNNKDDDDVDGSISFDADIVIDGISTSSISISIISSDNNM